MHYNVRVFRVPPPEQPGQMARPAAVTAQVKPTEVEGFQISAADLDPARAQVRATLESQGWKIRGVSFTEDGGIVAYVWRAAR